MSKVPSRLYSTFKPAADDVLFEVQVGDTVFSDDQILSITTTRGAAGPAPSVTPSTVEVQLNGAVNAPRNEPLTIRTGARFASDLASASPYTGTEVRQRFNGRKAHTSTEDRRWNRNDLRARWTTTITGASWTSLLRNTDRTTTATASLNCGSIVVATLNHPDLNTLQPVTYASLAKFDKIAQTIYSMPFNDAMGKFADELHTLVQHQRAGSVRVIPITQRRDDLAAAGPVWTILRAHCLSPATWSSPSEVATTQYSIRYTTSAGTPFTQEWPLSSDVSVIPLKGELVDVEYVQKQTDSLDLMMAARNRATNVSRQGVESVTLDLGLLWRMGTPSSLRTIAEVLRLEAGAPVHLGADWPVAVRGPYFADQISESITPDGWTVEISLSHARYVLGLADVELPIPLPLTWDATTSTWNTTPGTWG